MRVIKLTSAALLYSLVHSTETAPRLFHYLPQAYLSWKPSASHELTESHQNWNTFLVGMLASLNVRR